jgi:hypothetical protein
MTLMGTYKIRPRLRAPNHIAGLELLGRHSTKAEAALAALGLYDWRALNELVPLG